MAETTDEGDVAAHYSSGRLAERIFKGLQALGKGPDRLKPQDLAAVDQFHVGGRAATAQLIKLAAIQPGWRVLDVGGGLGGAARMLASQMRCQVTVLDLTEEFVEVGAILCERMDLAGLVHFRHGSALDMPFENERFDAVWMQHSTMNVEDKSRLLHEVYRVLRPRGRLAMHEVVAGPVQPARYPAPWSADGSASFLLPQAELRALVAKHAFRELAWEDVTAPSLEWFKRVAPVPGAAPAPLGLHLILGDRAGEILLGQIRNLADHRLEVVQASFERR